MDQPPAIIIEVEPNLFLFRDNGANNLILVPGASTGPVIVPQYHPNSHIKGPQYPTDKHLIPSRELMGEDEVLGSSEDNDDSPSE